MAVGYSRAGRPCLVADIDTSQDPSLTLWDEFFDTCRALRYSDIRPLSRIFKVTPRTIENWKYGITYPGDGIARQTIDWVERGKPMKAMLSSQSIADMI